MSAAQEMLSYRELLDQVVTMLQAAAGPARVRAFFPPADREKTPMWSIDCNKPEL